MTTYTPPGQPPPYEDELGADGYPRYKWRGTDAFAYDNVALRRAMELGKPLVWFIGVRPGMYDPIYPVTLAGEEPERHQFVLAVDETMQRSWGPGLVAAAPFVITQAGISAGHDYAEGVVVFGILWIGDDVHVVPGTLLVGTAAVHQVPGFAGVI